MRHKCKRVRKMNLGAQKKGLVVRNMITSLIREGEIKTTSKRAKVLKSEADKFFVRLLKINKNFEKNSDQLKSEYENRINDKIKKGKITLVGGLDKKSNSYKKEVERDSAIENAKKKGMDLLQVGIDENEVPRCKIISFEQYLNNNKRREFARYIKSVVFTKDEGKKVIDELLPKYIKGQKVSGFVADYKLGVRPGDGAEKVLIKLI